MRIISGELRGTNLFTLDGDNTRPTLDRIKESLFNIIQYNTYDSVVLDLFAGSGALGLEMLSRGAKKAFFCDKSKDAISVINKNIEKTRLNKKTTVFNCDYKDAIQKLSGKEQFDIIFIDPPYMKNIATDAVNLVIENDLLKEDGIIILETDDEKRELEQLQEINVNVKDLRKYGRVKLIFLNRKG